MSRQSGFTLIEVMLAISVLALIVVVTFTALAPAGQGFTMLKEVRDSLDQRAWLSDRLQSDFAYLSSSRDSRVVPLRLTDDSRGGDAFDELWILVREPGRPSLSYIHYYIDEEDQQLIRESAIPWAEDADSQKWKLAEVTSLDVEVLNQEGQWTQRWETSPFKWPVAIRISLKSSEDEQQWVFYCSGAKQ